MYVSGECYIPYTPKPEPNATRPLTSPDGKQVASGTVFPPFPPNLFHPRFTGSTDNSAIIWSVESGEKDLGPLVHHRDWVS